MIHAPGSWTLAGMLGVLIGLCAVAGVRPSDRS